MVPVRLAEEDDDDAQEDTTLLPVASMTLSSADLGLLPSYLFTKRRI